LTDKSIYNDDTYRDLHPSWHTEDSFWKANQLLKVFPQELVSGSIRVADLGCGTGGILSNFCKILEETETASVISADGFDISEYALDNARRTFPEYNFIKADITRIELSQKYDIVLLIDVIEHLDNPETILDIAKKCADFILLHIPLEDNWYVNFHLKRENIQKQAGHLHFFNRNSAFNLLSKTGLNIRKYAFTPGFELSDKNLWGKKLISVRC